MTTALPNPHQMSPADRRAEAFTLVDEIRQAIAGGKSFTSPPAADFFVDMREELKRGPHAYITPGRLEFLRKVHKRMKGRK